MADLGKIAIRPRGKFVVGTAYEKLDLVEYEGSSYLSIKDTTIAPVDDGIQWMLIAKKGIDDIATIDLAGLVKPDGTTITIDEDGTLHGASQVPDGVTYIKNEDEGEFIPPLPTDADMLGGKLPEYYVSADSVINGNLLINGDFNINQRGQTVYTANGTSGSLYTVDRFCISNSSSCIGDTLTLNGTGTISYSTNTYGAGLSQYLTDFGKYRGSQLVLSCNIISLSGTFSLYFDFGEAMVNVPDIGLGLSYVTAIVPENAMKLGCRLVNLSTAGTQASAEIEWMKLEPGKEPTPFMPIPESKEIEACRYFYREIGGKYPITTERTGGLYTHLSFENMRVNPTITLKNNDINTVQGFAVMDMGSGAVAGGFTFDATAYNNKYIQINATKVNHGLDYKKYMISAHTNYLCLDAEIY